MLESYQTNVRNASLNSINSIPFGHQAPPPPPPSPPLPTHQLNPAWVHALGHRGIQAPPSQTPPPPSPPLPPRQLNPPGILALLHRCLPPRPDRAPGDLVRHS